MYFINLNCKSFWILACIFVMSTTSFDAKSAERKELTGDARELTDCQLPPPMKALPCASGLVVCYDDGTCEAANGTRGKTGPSKNMSIKAKGKGKDQRAK